MNDIKPSVDSESNDWEFPQTEAISNSLVDEKPGDAQDRKTRKRSNNVSIKSEDSDVDDTRYSNGNSEKNSREAPTREKYSENSYLQTSQSDIKKSKKKGKDQGIKSRDAIQTEKIEASTAEIPLKTKSNKKSEKKLGRPRKYPREEPCKEEPAEPSK